MPERRVYRLKAGKISNLAITMEQSAQPEPSEVQVMVKAIGLNFADIFAIWGLYSATPKDAFIPGLEYAGVIARVGSEVDGFEVGQRVMGITRFGAYASVINIDSRYVVPLPANWSFQEGAAYLVTIMTAYYGLFHLGNLEAGQRVLIHSGAGGVGIWANRLAKAIGAYTIGTTGSESKLTFMRSEGYDMVIVRSKRFKDEIELKLGERPLNVVMECIGGHILEDGFEMLAPEGRMVVYGSAQYATRGNQPNYLHMAWKYLTRPKIDPLKLPNQNKSLLGFNLIWLYHKVDKMHQLLKEIEKHTLGKPYVGQTFAFEQLPAAVHLLKSGRTIGKVVVEVD